MNKSFIDIQTMKSELLEMLKTEFENKQYFNTETIDIKLSIKELVNTKLTELQLEEPKINMTADAFLKIRSLVDSCDGEVAWHGLVERHLNNFLISDILVFPQHVTGTTADGVDSEYEMWIATQPDEIFDKLRFHGHSHVRMGVVPSAIDENYYSNLMTHVQDYYITMIINKQGNIHARLYDKINNILYSHIPISICNEAGVGYDDWYETNKDMIRIRPVVTYKSIVTPATILTKVDSITDEDFTWEEDQADWREYLSQEKHKKKGSISKRDRKALKKEFDNRRKTDIPVSPKDLVRIVGPDNIPHTFVSYVTAVDYIYNEYKELYKDIDKKKMFDYLATNNCLVFDDEIGNFNYTILGTANGLQIAIMQKELWEVTKNESK